MFEFGKATPLPVARASAVARAFRRQGRPVVLVPVAESEHEERASDTRGVHAGHLALISAARRIPGAVVMVASDRPLPALAEAKVDVVCVCEPQLLRTRVAVPTLDPPMLAGIDDAVTKRLRLLLDIAPSDVIYGEKDYELLVRTQQAITDLHVPVKVHSVPTVRMHGGLAVSWRNASVPQGERERAEALAASLTAGAYAAERGAEAVVNTTREVLEAAGVTPDFVRLTSLSLEDPPERGDARLFVSATFGGVQLHDSAGVPVGIGFQHLDEEREARQEDAAAALSEEGSAG